MSAKEYEEIFRSVVESETSDRDGWRDIEGIEIEEVFLDDSYPDTRLALIFRAVRSRKIDFGQPTDPACRFGYRVRMWPAGDANPLEEARFWSINFMEFLGTNRRGYGPVRGLTPCDPDRINWLIA